MLNIILLVVILIAFVFVMSLAAMSSASDEQMEKMYEDYINKSETEAAAKEQKVKSYNSCKNTDDKMKELNMTDGDSASSSVRH